MVSDVLGVELSNDRTDPSCVSSAPDEMDLTNAFTPSPLVSVSAPWLNESAVDQTTDINDTFPADLRFNENSLTVVIVYCVLFLVAAVGNLTVFITLFKSRHRKSRISLMITHLAVADLMVTFIMIPLEVGWRLTVQWLAGNLACKVFLFLRAFGLYLSSNVLVCVSLDRYFAILHPLRVNDARRRGKFMLACAWVVSLLWSVPQSIVFHVSPHPKYPSFYQCVSFGFFTSAKQEMAYNLFCVLAVYFFPLIVILVSYTAIMCEISHKSKETNADCYQPANGRMRLRRSDMTNIERARSRTLKMTVTIVVVFVWCWTPYVVMTLWYMFDRDSAAKVANWIQDALFMMAVSNSCMNPMVYGSYAMNFRKECSRCLGCCIVCPQDSPSRLARKGTDVDGGAGQGGIKRRVIKCVYTLRKVGSATRSTAMLHGVMRSPAGTPQTVNHTTGNHLLKSPVRTIARPPSVGHISLVSEPLDNGGGGSYRPSFHSDPTGQSPYLRAERNVSNIELYSHNMDMECTSSRPIL